MSMSNAQITDLLRSVAAALTLKKRNLFEIRAYQNAADAIEHSTAEIHDLYDDNRLDDIPGIGKTIKSALIELFEHGESKHFESLMKDIPQVVFELIKVPGIGPKTALELANLGIKSVQDLEDQVKSGKLVQKGFSPKIAERLVMGVTEHKGLKTGRMLLPYATTQAQIVLDYLRKSSLIKKADPLGSLRRQVATIGDLDFSASAENPAKAIEYFLKWPQIREVVGSGENKATVVLRSGLHVDLLVGKPESYGALLQHFTGSKHHNIKLRTYALKRDLSLNELGVENTKTGKLVETKTEEQFYSLLKMQTPAPEMREDAGEIEVALAHKLPKLITVDDIKGDLHLHSNFPFKSPSHGPGVNPLEEIVKKAKELDYEYVGLSDHPPAFGTTSAEEMSKEIAQRTKNIEQLKSSNKSIRVLNGLEIDILNNGKLSVPDEVLATLDYCIAGIHSGHRKTSKDEMTERILEALLSPHVDILSHPTGRLLNERESYDAHWEKIFKFCAENHKLLEINAFPNRLDLRDDLVKLARSFGVNFVIDTDAHEISQMENMPFGVAVARRGWVEAKDIVNAWKWNDFAKWFGLK